MKKLSETFRKLATGKNVIVCIIILVLFFCISMPLLSIFAHKYMSLTSLDSLTIYSQEEIFDIIEKWGRDGRVWEIIFHFTWDLILPLIVIIFFGLTISWFTKKCFSADSKMQTLNLFALLYCFDLLENVAIGILIISYPSKVKFVATLKNVLTLAKYFSGIIIILIIIALSLKLITTRLLKRS